MNNGNKYHGYFLKQLVTRPPDQTSERLAELFARRRRLWLTGRCGWTRRSTLISRNG